MTMNRILAPVFYLLGWSKQPELRRMVEFLKEENRILRSKLPRQVPVTPEERGRLVRLGKNLGIKIRDLIGIVTYRTFLRWCNLAKKGLVGKKAPKIGRPRTPVDIEGVIVQLARENRGWGYTRIIGMLKFLGLFKKIARNTIKNILLRNGFDPGPRRGPGSWDEYLKIHLKTLWACDFVVKKILTKWGMVECFVLFFIHLGTRRVLLGGVTKYPDGPWMARQARNLCICAEELAEKPTILIRDGDKKFTEQFDAILQSEGIESKKLPAHSPNLNAYAERWVQSFKVECLDHFLVFGEEHLRYIAQEYTNFYNRLRPHQALGNEVLCDERPSPIDERTFDPDKVKREPILGGLINHYAYKAA